MESAGGNQTDSEEDKSQGVNRQESADQAPVNITDSRLKYLSNIPAGIEAAISLVFGYSTQERALNYLCIQCGEVEELCGLGL